MRIAHPRLPALGRALILLVLACPVAYGQAADALPAFEAASVKLSAVQVDPFAMRPGLPQAGIPIRDQLSFASLRGGPGTDEPGQIVCFGCALLPIVASAYEVSRSQVQDRDELIYPRYDLIAKVPPGSTRHSVNLMLQQLLVERFHFVLHREKINTLGYAMVVGKQGRSMHPAEGLESVKDPTLFPILGGNRLFTLTGYHKSMRQLADAIAVQTYLPVVDMTGLKGVYDFSLTWLANPGLSHPKKRDLPSGVTKLALRVEDAVRWQLGLKLVARRLPADLIVVDSLLREPVEN